MLTLVGVVLVIIAIVCACMLVFSSKPKLEKLLASSRVSIGDTLKAYHETKASLGDMGKEGVVSEDMTIMGKPRCESPLTSPLGQKEMPLLFVSRDRKTQRTRDVLRNGFEWESSRTHAHGDEDIDAR